MYPIELFQDLLEGFHKCKMRKKAYCLLRVDRVDILDIVLRKFSLQFRGQNFIKDESGAINVLSLRVSQDKAKVGGSPSLCRELDP